MTPKKPSAPAHALDLPRALVARTVARLLAAPAPRMLHARSRGGEPCGCPGQRPC